LDLEHTMGRRLTLDLPDETYEAIRARAEALGETPEQIVLERLNVAPDLAEAHQTRVRAAASPAGRASDEAGDPLAALVGTLECAATDVADRHDEYIGRAIAGVSAAR
jgi:hypothetical protein